MRLWHKDLIEVFPNKMNMRYLKQCYYNLEEKFDCGGVSIEEFELIYALAKQIMAS